MNRIRLKYNQQEIINRCLPPKRIDKLQKSAYINSRSYAMCRRSSKRGCRKTQIKHKIWLCRFVHGYHILYKIFVLQQPLLIVCPPNWRTQKIMKNSYITIQKSITKSSEATASQRIPWKSAILLIHKKVILVNLQIK